MSMIAVDEPKKSSPQTHTPMYAEAIHRLYQKGATAPLARVLNKLLPADIAHAINSSYDLDEAMDIFELIASPVQAGATLKELREEFQSHILTQSSVERAVPILESLPPDTRSQIIGSLSPDVGDRLMNALRHETQKEVQNLLQYLPDTAGSLMTSRFFALPETTTASEAILAVRGLASYEFVFYVYALDDKRRLTGVSSLRQLLLSPAAKPIKDIMDPRVYTVNVDTPQEEAAKVVTRNRLLAIPVVNDMGALQGIITVDDLINVIQDTDTQAMLKVAGVDADEQLSILTQTPFSIAKNRLPWLVAPFMGGLLAAFILSYYEHTMAQVIQLSFFMPMIFGMAGNVGSQTATVAVRGLATGDIRVSDYLKLLFKETQVGILIGTFYGICLAIYALVVFKSPILAFTVGVSILSNITYSGIIASTLPILIQKMGFDPAIGGGPYVLTAVDVLGVVNYLVIATLVYGL